MNNADLSISSGRCAGFTEQIFVRAVTKSCKEVVVSVPVMVITLFY